MIMENNVQSKGSGCAVAIVVGVIIFFVLMASMCSDSSSSSSSYRSSNDSNLCEMCGKNPKYLGKLCSSCYENFAKWQEKNGY